MTIHAFHEGRIKEVGLIATHINELSPCSTW